MSAHLQGLLVDDAALQQVDDWSGSIRECSEDTERDIIYAPTYHCPALTGTEGLPPASVLSGDSGRDRGGGGEVGRPAPSKSLLHRSDKRLSRFR